MEEKNPDLWRGLGSIARKHLDTRSYAKPPLAERLHQLGMANASELVNGLPAESAIPGVEVFHRKVFHQRFRGYFAHPTVKIALLGLLWAYLHHFCAGIRYLFMDIDQGVGLAATRKSSYAVLAVSLALTALLGAKLW